MVQRLFSPEQVDFNYERLKRLGAKAWPLLRDALDDPHVAKRYDKDRWHGPDYPLQLICRLLEPIDRETVVRHLTAHVEHEDPDLRRCAAVFLGEFRKFRRLHGTGAEAPG